MASPSTTAGSRTTTSSSPSRSATSSSCSPPEEIDPKYKRWTLDVLPILPDEFRYKPKQGQSDRMRTIQRLLERDDVD